MTSPTNIRPRDPRLDPKKAGALAKARAAWESRPVNANTRIFASFDDMLDAFASDCLRLSEIAVAVGVSRERARQVWRDYFAHLFRRGRTGRQRWRACTISTLRKRTLDARPIGLAGEVAEIAQHHGLTVAPDIKTLNRTVSVSRRRLTINGHRCVVSVSKSPCKSNPLANVRYFTFRRIIRERCGFRILKCGAPLNSYFVMPREVVEFWGGARGIKVFLPERPNTYPPNLGRTDWIWQYREAWHLLRADADARRVA